MAARINPKHTEEARARIKTTQLLNRLQGFALGEKEPVGGKPIQMTDAQARVALGLIRKVLPDLTSTTLTGQDGGPLQVETSTVRLRLAERLSKLRGGV